MQRVREHYDKRFQAHSGTGPTWAVNQGQRLSALLKRHTPDEIIRRIDIAFDHPGIWPYDRDFLTIASPKHFDRFASAPRSRQGPANAASPRPPTRVVPPKELSFDGQAMPDPSERLASASEATIIPITHARRAERQSESTEPELDVPAVPDLFGSL